MALIWSHCPGRTQGGSLKKGQTCEAKPRFKILESRCWGSVAFWAQGGRGLCLLWLPGKRRLFITLQKSVTNLTSTDQKSLMACYFAVFLLTPDAHRGQVNLLDWLLWLYTQRIHPSTGCECVVFSVAHTLYCFLMMIFHQLDILWIHCK